MSYLKHLVTVITTILFSKYNYSKANLLFSYVLLVIYSVAFHKFKTSKQKSQAQIKTKTILGYSVSFFTYPQILHLMEEIFISQIYKFTASTSTPLIIDCGSNIGMSILYFQKLYPSCRIIGFEPDPETFRLLQENIHKNGLKNVTLFNFALGEVEEKTWLYTNYTPGRLGMSLTSRNNNSTGIPVYTKKISNYIFDRIDLVKIDTEGAEISIMQDISDNNKLSLITKIIIEYHESITQVPVQKFVTKLEESGLRCDVMKNTLFKDVVEVMIHCRNAALSD
jgi:FkbM family methyltransferase